MNFVTLALIGFTGFALGPFFLRSKGVYVFWMLMTGKVLDAYILSTDIINEPRFATTSEFPIGVRLALLFAPAAIVMVFTKGTVKKKKLPYHALGALASGGLAILWVVELLLSTSTPALRNDPYYLLTVPYYAVFLAIGVVASLLLAWSERPKPDDKK